MISWNMLVCKIRNIGVSLCSWKKVSFKPRYLICLHVKISHSVPGDHHHLPRHKVPACLIIPVVVVICLLLLLLLLTLIPGHQVGCPAEVLRLVRGPPVDLAPAPGVNVSIEGGDDGVVHGELNTVEGGDLSEKAHQAILINLKIEDLQQTHRSQINPKNSNLDLILMHRSNNPGRAYG